MKNEYDLLKVFAIQLVVLGHITILYGGGSFGYLPYDSILTTLMSLIYLFHMPLFISLSGAIYYLGCERGKYVGLFPFLTNKVLRILLPFVVIGTFFLAPTLTVLEMTKLSYIECVGNILILGGEERHLWFLPALFWIFLIVFVFRKFRVPIEYVFAISVASAIICSLFIL